MKTPRLAQFLPLPKAPVPENNSRELWNSAPSGLSELMPELRLMVLLSNGFIPIVQIGRARLREVDWARSPWSLVASGVHPHWHDFSKPMNFPPDFTASLPTDRPSPIFRGLLSYQSARTPGSFRTLSGWLTPVYLGLTFPQSKNYLKPTPALESCPSPAWPAWFIIQA